jgi:hypothetical protein
MVEVDRSVEVVLLACLVKPEVDGETAVEEMEEEASSNSVMLEEDALICLQDRTVQALVALQKTEAMKGALSRMLQHRAGFVLCRIRTS